MSTGLIQLLSMSFTTSERPITAATRTSRIGLEGSLAFGQGSFKTDEDDVGACLNALTRT